MSPDPSPCRRRARSYWTTCHCDNCIAERSRKRKLHSVGKPYRVPNEVAWAALVRRFEQGWTARAAASACGLPDYYLAWHHAEWKRGNSVHLGPALAQMVMTMGRPTAGQVGAEPTRRRLRALAAIGYSLTTLADETGIKVSALAMIRNRNVRCGASAAATIEDTYERLHMTPGPDPQAVTSARTKQWPSPLAWDDIADDLAPARSPKLGRWSEHIDEALVMRVVNGGQRPRNLTTAETLEVIRRLRARGLNTHQIEGDYGIKAYRHRGSVA